MPSPRRRYAPHPQKNSLSLRTSAHTGVAIRTPPTAPSLHGGNGFPRRCAPRNDSFMKMRRPWTGGAEPPPDMHRTSNKILVIANRCAHRCGNPYPVPCAAPSPHRENGFPRRCAPRNDIFMKMRCPWTGGAEPPPLRLFCKFLCRAAPMCAAADTHRTSNGGAHWPRPTGENINPA